VANVGGGRAEQDCPVAITIIVSYDGTPNDDDGLALAKMLAAAGGSLALAYVRHSREYDPRREEIGQHDAERRLQQGAIWLGDESLPRHVVVDPSTGEGLAKLAAAEGAALIVFGSDYRTSPGRVEPGAAAQRLLEGGTVAVAVAQAGLRTQGEATIAQILVAGPEADDAAVKTASALATATGATIAAPGEPDVNLIVVGSQPTTPPGRIALSGAARTELDSAHSSALVLPYATPVLF
jgi:nucleotide-binding universal stress UspA family protein